MPKITKIEPIVPLVKPRLKVAAYARVSKETERLMHSLSAQVSYYSDLIQKNPEAAYDNIIAQIAEKNKRVQRMQTFIKNVQELGVITEFDEELWGVLVESVTVYSKDDIRVEFRN